MAGAKRGQAGGGQQDQRFSKIPQTSQNQDQAGPFIRYAKEHTELGFDTGALTMPSTGGTTFGPRDIPAIGYLRRLHLDTNVVATNATTTTVAVPTATTLAAAVDQPYNWIQQLQILDIGGSAVYDLNGTQAQAVSLFGGSRWWPDTTVRGAGGAANTGTAAVVNPSWTYPISGTASAAPAAGTTRFQLLVPFELFSDGFGALPNTNAAAAYKARLVTANTGTMYATAPSGGVTLDQRADIDVWTEPVGRPDITPPSLGTTGYWSAQYYASQALQSGTSTIRLLRVGYRIHTLIFILRDANGVRADFAAYPSTDFRIRLDGFDYVGPTTMVKLLNDLADKYGIFPDQTAIGVTAPNSTWTRGILPFTWRHDPDGHPDLADSGELWLPTTGGTRLEVTGTFSDTASTASGSMTLEVVTGDVVPRGAIPYAPYS